MYRSGLVPRGMALLGLIGGPLAFAGGTGVLLGLFEQPSAPLFLLTAPGVWLVLGLVGMLYVDQTPLSASLKTLVRVTLLVAPTLVSLGFFLSVVSPKAERPNGLINLIYLAALLLAVGVVTLGIGLFQA
jgi:hypothetical protein